ncbi:unnamed protein product [Cuscuta europaea]|uniref:6,7-dimethyl-8-ribityllumazine synthase n=1 Tax=Cuscuta europaea TaxID=41803 RepID=A0A9P1E2C7_CUSEU|nr:unnamed protein product [Cuscuta europaea]
MGNTLRCCLACVLPCGALDLIRIVHLNGHIDEITHPITAAEVLKNNPNHVLSKPTSQGMVRRILIISPTSELKRGSIYFLIPASSVPRDQKKKLAAGSPKSGNKKLSDDSTTTPTNNNNNTPPAKQKTTSQRHRRSNKVGEWRPHLASISEDY